MSKKTVVVVVKLVDIRENPVALRAVDKESEAFLGLRDSIREVGLLNAISLREKVEKNEAGKDVKYYELIDGLHRYSAALDAGLKEVPAILKDLSDIEVEEAQIMANVHKIETRPVEYTKQLNRILASNPTMTIVDLAGRLCKSDSWVSQRLGLLKLAENIRVLVDDGKINLSNAIALAKLPQEEQVNFVDRAITQNASEFIPTVQSRAKQLKDAARAGKKAAPAEFVPVARLQKMSDFKAEMENPAVGPELVKAFKVKDAVAGFALGVAWGANVDPRSIEIQRAKAEVRQRTLEEAKIKRTVERTAKKADEAKKAAEEAAAIAQK